MFKKDGLIFFRSVAGNMAPIKYCIIAHNCRTGGGLIIAQRLLEQMLLIESHNQFFVIYPQGYGYEDILKNSTCCQSYCYKNPHTAVYRLYFEEVALPRIITRYHPDVIFGMGNIGITKPKCPQALFVHNAYLYYDYNQYPKMGYMDWLRICALKHQVIRCLVSTQLVFVQTPIVKERFCRYSGYPFERVKILRFPVPEKTNQATYPVPDFIQGYDDRFKVLYLTRYMPHRNPEIVLELCSRYNQALRKANIVFFTTVSPSHGNKSKQFLRHLMKGEFSDLIINVGELSRWQVVQYYHHSDILWLHTLLETLCFPFLEAMSLGRPILAPDFDFSRYVCGDAAVYYEPFNLNSAYECLMKIRDDEQLRKKLIMQGFQEIKKTEKFSNSWESLAREILDHLKTIIIR